MNDEHDRVWQQVVEIGAAERHFNELQHHYRALCSTWMLAAFGAIGYVVTSQELPADYPREIIGACLSVAAAGGATLLWLLDLRVYHQLLDACFGEGLRLEREHAWLPQLRTRMIKTQKAYGVLGRVVWFYVITVVALLLPGGALLASYFAKASPTHALIAATLSAAIALLWAFILRTCTLSTPFKELAENNPRPLLAGAAPRPRDSKR